MDTIKVVAHHRETIRSRVTAVPNTRTEIRRTWELHIHSTVSVLIKKIVTTKL